MAGEDEATRLRDLARMRAIATGLLGLMAVVFILASLFDRRWPALQYLRAFAEAGMVGACADWFAVTALFRRPLGLPIPHTAIVPRSKDRIGAALGAFIAENFLTVDVLDGKLDQLEVTRWGGAWLRDPANAARLAEQITRAIPRLVELAPLQARRDLVTAAATGVLKATPAAPLASAVLGALWREGRAQPLLDRVVELLGDYLKNHEALVRSQLSGRAARWLPRWIDDKIVDRVIAAIAQILQEMRDPEHPWRVELHGAISAFIGRLRTDPALRERGEALKAGLLKNPRPLVAQLELAWTRLAERLKGDDGGEDFAEPLARVLVSLGEWLETDDAARATLNNWARMAVREVVAPQRHRIGRFIAQVVAAWDTRSVVEKLELQVGRDLQYIRVNGTLVGGLVGLAIFAAARLLGLA